MDTKELYREILNEHNLNPSHKKEMTDPTLSLNGVNPSCGDNITLNLKVGADNRITDGSFTGSGCAVSQASVDMMLDLIIGKPKDEALTLADTFMNMIKGTATQEQIETLDEAGSLADIAHMPARVKCAVLGWHTMQDMIKHVDDNENSGSGNSTLSGTGTAPHCEK